MRLAYADPPYVGQAKRHYSNDPSGIPAAEVDYLALVEQLREYDGWALSASSPSLAYLLTLVPEARIAAWVKPFASWKPSHRVQYTWEPVLFVPVRPRGSKSVPSVRDYVSANITLRRGTHGAKPDAFGDWIINLLGAQIGDTFDDLFPGSGQIAAAWDRWRDRVNAAEDARIEAIIRAQYPDLPPIEGDDYIPDSIADIAAEHGVTEAQLRQALRESHPDASVAEVMLRAREIA
jgi:hypothetical protein